MWGEIAVLVLVSCILFSFIIPRDWSRLLELFAWWLASFVILEIIVSVLIVNWGQFSSPERFYIEFEVNDVERFRSLSHIFAELQKDKYKDSFRSDADWLAMFDEKARAHFWWSTEQERQSYRRLWDGATHSQRLTDPSLQKPWDFSSMIDAFQNGEYELASCRMISADRGRLEFSPHASPFGGTGCMRALVQAFGFRVVKAYDD